MSGLSGRFLSRDPIGYEDGRLLYSQLVWLSKVDPQGTISIKVADENLNSEFNKCTERSVVKWKITLSNKAGKLCNGTGGWLIQKITIRCSGEPCPTKRKCDPASAPETKSFWEGWYVNKDEDTPSLFGDYTDLSGIPARPGSCGRRRHEGEVRFYCHRKTTTIKKPITVTACGVPVTSLELPATEDEPQNTWAKNNGDDGVAKRWHQRDWNCCPDCPVPTDYDKATMYPL
jgi:hypothetical protein